ncbi:2-deoxyribose-5-phosphate aldolase [Mycobacterium sp. GA-1285]|uniref:deoxyribose-phosphate aldolase n=1 Tax=Mycobacterium sp. GA-1285 TaxID=1772282 RepID=UPI00074A3582|nr:deoxyribose-phosphate aldolase [Mycobacterium sp. GA-1285]KUI13032.1 2-deoxyribose-5-phosphate aldolase [Mycobacterium sp. GA-1285]
MVGIYRRDQVAKLVDHTLLKPEATPSDVAAIAEEAATLGVHAVCVSPSMVSVARRSGSAAQLVCAVVGFPSGKHLSAIKAREARLAVDDGAGEIDMVIDVGAALDGDFAAVRADVDAVRTEIGARAVLKVIVESAALLQLADEQTLLAACRAAADAGADFVKTSTGFHPAGGASVRAVELMATVGPQVKASGGIRTAGDAIAMLNAGAARLGLSGTRVVLEGIAEN